MTRPTTYELYGCPCGWRVWISDRPDDELAGADPQAVHDAQAERCASHPDGTGPVMLVDRAKGGARS